MINIAQLVQDIIDGNEDPIRGLVTLRKLKSEVENALNEIEDEVLDEVKKHEESFTKYGCKITQRKGSIRYSFKHIPEWNTYDQMKKDCESRYKLAYQNSQKGMMAANNEGEVLELPHVTHSKDSYSLTFLDK